MAFKWLRYLFAQSGDRSTIPGPVDLSGNVSYEQGYGPDYQRPKTDPLAKDIERDKMNSLFYDLSGNIQHYQLNGVPDWVPAADNGGVAVQYPIGARVRYAVNDLVYVSNVAANVSTPGANTDWRLEGGQFLRAVVLTSSGTYTRGAGARSGRLRAVGGGGGGGSTSATAAGQVSVAAGGQNGADGEHVFINNLPASQAYTIGAGGGSGSSGGSTVFGSLTCPGGGGSATSTAGTPPVLIGANNAVAVSTGFNVRNGRTGPGGFALAVGGGGFVSGAGAPSVFGPGAAPNVTGSAAGVTALNPGAGGAGASAGASSGAFGGGGGAPGLIIIDEFS